jgi:hypothetical protein
MPERDGENRRSRRSSVTENIGVRAFLPLPVIRERAGVRASSSVE